MNENTQYIKEKKIYQKPEIKSVGLASEMLRMNCGHTSISQLLLF